MHSKLMTTVLENIDWLVLGFIGVIMAILRTDTSKVSKKAVVTTLISGMFCSIAVPLALTEWFNLKSMLIGWLGAWMGGLVGMRIVAALHGLDVQAIIEKKLGVGK